MQDVGTYLEGDFKEVQGWCSPWLWKAITPIIGYQDWIGLKNPVAEIGVFHGKFLIPLILNKKCPALNHAFDVFDLQQFNLDGAGEGNLAALQSNFRQAGIADDAVEIIKADSTAITQNSINQIRETTGGFSIFSVDGCHTAVHTLNDINLAMQLTHEAGVIFVDDFENPHWPEVAEAVARMYILNTPKFIPLCNLFNKLILCHISHYVPYLETLVKTLAGEATYKIVKRYGYESVTI